ncbi:MAG TPA: hypothetical protein VE666_01285 [Mycobacterium sp.]|nr:hypothetical protein [Mycobacterium sp.]
MSWWKSLRGPSEAARAGEPTWPVELEVVPGKLFARVYLHDIDFRGRPIACWSYVSRGLIALDHAEIVFTLRRNKGEPSDGFPQDPLHLLATIYQLADDGQRVGPGDVTGFSGRTFLGHHLLYAEPQPLDRVPLPQSCLAALLITADELRAVTEFGSTRVLARMGQVSGYYPYPPWADRCRRGLSLGETFEHSLLSKPIPRFVCPDVCVAVESNQIIVSALRGAQPPWRDRLGDLPDHVPLALLTALDPTANGCLVWVPGQSAPEAITPPRSDGSRLCGCFVVLLPEQPENAGWMREDGFVMELSTDSWKAVRSALIEGTEVRIPVEGSEMSFVLTWRDRKYDSSFDDWSDPAERGWGSDQPTTAEAAPATGNVTIKQVRLLTPEHELAARSSAGDLAAFCQEVQRCAQRAIGDRGDAAALVVRMRCTPEGHDVDLACREEVPQSALQAFAEAVKQLARLPVEDGEVSFEIELAVSR